MIVIDHALPPKSVAAGRRPATVLVLLAAFNGAPWIERQLASVLAQRGVAVQIMVRDDGSTDHTRDIVSEIAAHDLRVRLLPGHASSGSASANFFHLIAAADSKGFDVIAFCDQDDEWFENKLARAIDCLARHGAAGYSAAVKAQWEDGREKFLGQSARQRSADYLFEGAGQGCTFVLTRDLFLEVQASLSMANGMLGEIHYHDWLVYAIARSLGRIWHFDTTAVMTYHQHEANDTGARNSLSGVKRRLALIRRGWYRQQVDAMGEFIRCVSPTDIWAWRWHALMTSTSALAPLQQLVFVVQHGRRRRLDRFILAGAVLGGRL